MLKIGEKIPNLDLITHKGEKINLHDFKGKKIVLFFYWGILRHIYKLSF